jgi:hypothetical protein
MTQRPSHLVPFRSKPILQLHTADERVTDRVTAIGMQPRAERQCEDAREVGIKGTCAPATVGSARALHTTIFGALYL